MRAIKTNAALHLDTDYPEPRPADGEVLLKVLKAGICNTDLELVKGYMGFSGVLGHEYVGVAQGGPLDGRRVAGEINCACHRCETCLAGMPSQCPNRVTIGINQHDGAFADWVAVPQVNLHPIPEAVTDDQAVFVEPLAAALQILKMTHINPTDRVVLLGTGKLGLLCAQVIALTGCSLTAVSRHERQRDLLKDWGIDTAAPGELEHRLADSVIDCTGTEQGFADALDLVKPRGEIHLKSTYFGSPQANLTRLVVDEVRITTSRCGPFDAAIRLLDRGLVDVVSLVEAHYSLDDGLAAFEDASQHGRLKVILDVAG
jgi:threonine dehydrogenase-like Zn-dependent dehydrogenase